MCEIYLRYRNRKNGCKKEIDFVLELKQGRGDHCVYKVGIKRGGLEVGVRVNECSNIWPITSESKVRIVVNSI